MTSSVLEDPRQSLARIPQYWQALRQRALSRVPELSLLDGEIPATSTIYPARNYAKTPPTTDPSEIRRQLAAETACFERGSLVDPAGWTSLPHVADHFSYELVKDVGEEDHQRLADALTMIRTYWPEAEQEYLAHSRGIVWIKHRETYSGSDPKLYGIVFLNKAYFKAHPLVEMATDIIHEAGHHTLFVETAIDPMIPADFAKQLYSPIRQGDRPAIGVLHGLFSMLRMLLWSRRLTAAEPSRGDFRAEQDRMDALFRDGLKPAIADLKAIRLTPGGEALLDAMARVEKRLYG